MREGDTSCYELERPIMQTKVKDKEGVMLWFVIHEFCHLFYGQEKHTKVFFSKVLRFADDVPFFFDSDL